MPIDFRLQARWFLDPVDWALHENACIAIDQGRIVARDAEAIKLEAKHQLDYGDAVILPAFVNAHTHLDLSHLRGLPLSGDDFGSWLMAVVTARSAPISTITMAAEGAVSEMLATGTASVLDILATTSYAAEVAEVILKSGIHASIALEAIAPNPKAEAASFRATLGAFEELRFRILELQDETLAAYLQRQHEGWRTPQACLSPHAPYSVSPRLYRHIAAFAARNAVLQTTHLSEATSEREFLTTGGGILEPLYRKLGADPGQMRWTDQPAVATWASAVEGETIAGLNHTLVVHCYDLTDPEVQQLGALRASVVYCPRSRRYFGHPRFRFAELQRAGCRICFGTDSLGSTPNLDLMQELATARAEQPGVAALDLFRAATLNGRAAIQRSAGISDAEFSSLADLQVLRSPSFDGAGGAVSAESLLEAALEQVPPCLATFAGGRHVFQA